jgi:SAM-dependent methyltransferase
VSDPRHENNRKAWNEAAAAYRRDLEEGIAFLRGGGQNFCAAERPFLDRLLPCDLAIHLQCAGGTDTLSLWNAGARRVIGIDLSEAMLAVAAEKSAALQAPAEWVHADVLEVPGRLDGTADLVYTGRGATNWLMDLEGWAHTVARLLKPGGHLFLFEGHPVTWLFAPDAPELRLDPEPPYGHYFSEEVSEGAGWPATYVGDLLTDTAALSPKHEHQWTIAQTVNAVIGAGLVVESLGEYAENYWDMYPNWPDDLRARIPQTFTLLARRPVPV